MRSLQIQAKDFEEWLGYQHMIEEPTVLDDDLTDAFDAWLEDADLEAFAKRYGEDVAMRDLAVFKFDNGIE